MVDATYYIDTRRGVQQLHNSSYKYMTERDTDSPLITYDTAVYPCYQEYYLIAVCSLCSVVVDTRTTQLTVHVT